MSTFRLRNGVCRRSLSLVDPLGACAKTEVEASVSIFIHCLVGVCAPRTAQ